MVDKVHGVPLPPHDLVFMDPDARRGYELGVRFANRLGEIGVNVRDGLLLDIGCGYGRLAYGLLGVNFSGTYVGVDILPDRITFLQNNFSTAHPRYQFHLLEVRNDVYIKNHPQLSKSQQAFDIESIEDVDFSRYTNDTPDGIILLSVFTHMYDHDIVNYLRSMKRVMTRKSQLVFTAFVFNSGVLDRIDRGDAKLTFPHVLADHCRTRHAGKPLANIAYDEAWLARLLHANGFDHEYIPGYWSGVASKHYQDWILARLV